VRRPRGVWLALVAPIVLLLAAPAAAHAQTAANLLLVVNENSTASVRVGQYYAAKRQVPSNRIVRIKTVTTDAVSRAAYDADIQAPIASWLSAHDLEDSILYIVLTKGVPLRITGTGGLNGTTASVDSELTLLYRRMVGVNVPVAGRVDNPYYLGAGTAADTHPFTRFRSDIYLVTRLDGFTVDDVFGLIDRGAAPSQDGRIVLDEKATTIDRGGDQWLEQAAERLRLEGAGARVVLERTRQIATATGPVIGYYSWGSNDPANRLRDVGLTFANGAIGGMFVSTDGRTFTAPPETWRPANPGGTGGQSLAGDLIHEGLTGVSAHVFEPFLDATIRPQILFPSYLDGLNLAESFYLAMPYLSWQTVIVGDPLCAPFRTQELAPDDIAKPIDPATGLPALFSERRLALLSRSGFNHDALVLTLQADARRAHDPKADIEDLLVKATALEPRLVAAQLLLGSLYESRGEYAKAEERYRAMLAVDSRNAVALNNLAFALAVHDHKPQEALPLAEQAYRIAPAAAIADTLGWIQHLLGNDQAAAPLVERAVTASPADADMLVHAASVHAALGDKTRAAAELDAAVKADPSVAERDDVKALRAKIKGGSKSAPAPTAD
jgi:uncharacterized protein (TIGR03790 family)